MNAFSTRKRWAVWVVIAWLAAAISVWALSLAGDTALREPSCKACREAGDPCQLTDKLIDLELVGAPGVHGDARQILRCHGTEEPCIAGSVRARIFADFLFIPAYSSLMVFIFLLFSAPRATAERSAARLWALVGILPSLAMAVADVGENILLLRLVGPPCAGTSGPYLLWALTATKWKALALASVLAGLLALIRERGWVPALTGLVGIAAGAALAVGVFQPAKSLLNAYGPRLLFVFFSLALIHAVIVLIRPDPAAPLSPPPSAASEVSPS